MGKPRFIRGFIKETEEYAADYRLELDISMYEPLSALTLATHLAVPVTGLSVHPTVDWEIKQYYCGPGNSEFSATTLPDGV